MVDAILSVFSDINCFSSLHLGDNLRGRYCVRLTVDEEAAWRGLVPAAASGTGRGAGVSDCSVFIP